MSVIVLIIIFDNHFIDGDDFGPATAVILGADPPNFGPSAAAPFAKPV